MIFIFTFLDNSSIKERDNELSGFFSGQFKSGKILEIESNPEMGKNSSLTLFKDLDVEPHKETEELKAFKKEIKEASIKHNQKLDVDSSNIFNKGRLLYVLFYDSRFN